MPKIGDFIRAKPNHPIRSYAGGDGLAVITQDGCLRWINGDPRTPGLSGDTFSMKWFDTWFDMATPSEIASLPPREDWAPCFMADLMEGKGEE